jgi:hypothetical protein
MREIKCEITKAENGYVLSWEEEIDDNVFITKKMYMKKNIIVVKHLM